MKVVLTGASGQLGAYLVERLRSRGHDVQAWSGSSRGHRADVSLEPMDLRDPLMLATALDQADPDTILHAGAISSADAAFRDPAQARAVNVDATKRIAEWCHQHGRRLLFTSTDLVFEGTRSWYREDDPAEPLLEYGRTKRAGELEVLRFGQGLVCRLSLLFGFTRCGRPSFFDRATAAIKQGQPQSFFRDEYRTPLHLGIAADVLVRLLETRATGLLHVGGTERMSRYDLMLRTATALGLDASLVRSNLRSAISLAEPRPADVSLDTTRLATILPDAKRPSVEAVLSSI
jgi:dTDP-4-dehydrorhamnose reductase